MAVIPGQVYDVRWKGQNGIAKVRPNGTLDLSPNIKGLGIGRLALKRCIDLADKRPLEPTGQHCKRDAR